MPVEDGVTSDSPPAEVSVQPAVAQVDAAVTSDASAEPSPAKTESLMDRVTAALKPKTEGSAPSQASQDAKDPNAPPEGEEKEPEGDPTDEEMARLHSATRRRMKKLLGERNAANDGKSAAESKVAELTPHAEVGRRVTDFIASSGMSGDEANLLLEIGKNMKQNPLKALEQLKPYYDALSRMAGDVLPGDLQEAVTKGEITAPYARQLARTRTEAAVTSRRAETVEAESNQQRQVQQTQAHVQHVSGTISEWDRRQETSDPDWKLKQGRIGELFELDVRRNGFPKTAEAAIEQVEKARTAVNADFARLMPRKQAVTMVNPTSAARAVPAKPKTALEAVDLALAAAAG